MTMKQVAASAPSLAPRRLGVAEAKSKLSEVLRDTAKGPTIIHNRGRDLAVLLALQDYEHLLGQQPLLVGGGAALLGRLEKVKRRHAGGVDDFEPPRAALLPVDPFTDNGAAGRASVPSTRRATERRRGK